MGEQVAAGLSKSKIKNQGRTVIKISIIVVTGYIGVLNDCMAVTDWSLKTEYRNKS